MAANYNYAHHYARLDKEQTQQGYGTYDTDRNASSNTGLQYPSSYGSAYSHQSYQDSSNSATQPAAQWQGVSSKQPSTYHTRGGSGSQVTQSSATAYHGSQDAYNRNAFETSGMSRAEFRSNAPSSLTRDPPSQTAQNASSFYHASQPQYSQYQSQQQSQSGLAPHANKNSQYSRVPTRPMSVTSIASGQSDTMTESRQALPHTKSRAHPHSGHASSSQQPQSNQFTTPHRPHTAQQLSETVPANTSAARTSPSQSQHQSSSTVDPSQIYDPYLDIQRQATRNIEQQEAEKERRRQEKESAEAQSLEQARHDKGVQEAKKLASKATKTPRAKKGTSVRKPSTADDMSAAMTLMQTANANAQANPDATQSERDSLQTQMMEMFKKMREFNQKDPEMLSRLWQQERDQHLAQSDASNPSNPSDIAARVSTPTVDGKKRRGPKPGWKAAKAAAEAAGATATTTATGPDTSHNVAIFTPVQSISNSTQTSQPSTILATGTSATGGTVWPANKKGTLAQAAVNYLQLAPENKSRTITADQVSAVLDTNPNYVELCQAIELKGFKIDRGMFAKHLLKATSASGQSKVRPRGSSTTNVPMADAEARLQSGEMLLSTPKSKGQPQSKPTTAAKARAPNSTAPQGSSPIDSTLEGLDAVKAFVEDESRPASQMTTKSKPAKKPRQRNEASASATPGPASKEELARKRTFGDLVDLTQLSDSEEEVFFPPAKRLDQGSADNANLSLPSPPQTDQDASSGRPKTHPASTKLVGVDWSNIGPRQTAVPDIAAITRPVQNRPPHAPATGQTQASDPVQSTPAESVPSKTQESDLTRNIPLEHPARRAILALPIDKSKAFRRSAYDARTIARDVLLASGRHPDMRMLNAHLEHLKVAFPSLRDNNADLSTINWDVIDPGGPPPGSGSRVLASARIDIEDEADDEDDGDDVDKSLITIQARPSIITGGQLDSLMPGSLLQGKRRDGRPPKNRAHGAGTPVGQSARPLGAPNTASPAGSMGYAALRAVDEHGNPIKKKGRPVGWRKWMQKDVGAPPSAGKGPSVAKAKKADPEPVYQVYKCEWRDCRAELHNLATLRKHIHKVHGKCGTDGQWTCHWRECGFIQPITEANTHRTTSQFRQYTYLSIESWKGHVETVHLRPIAWKLGDGPVGGVSDRESELSEAYMSDRQGRRVTPQIDMPESDSTAMLRRFKRTAEEEARQEQANAERKKRETGIGVEKGGARLANEKRRQGFRDDDSDAQIIDNDDG